MYGRRREASGGSGRPRVVPTQFARPCRKCTVRASFLRALTLLRMLARPGDAFCGGARPTCSPHSSARCCAPPCVRLPCCCAAPQFRCKQAAGRQHIGEARCCCCAGTAAVPARERAQVCGHAAAASGARSHAPAPAIQDMLVQLALLLLAADSAGAGHAAGAAACARACCPCNAGGFKLKCCTQRWNE